MEHKRTHPRSPQDKKALANRLHRISGQLAGIERMIENDVYCGDVLIQLAAAQHALQSVAGKILEDHLHTCIPEKMQAGQAQEAMDEVASLIKKLK